MPDRELEQAIARLRNLGRYGWLLDGPDFISAEETTKQLNAMGIPVKQKAVTGWFGDLPSALDSGSLGRFAAREDVIKLLSSQFIQKASNE